MRLCFEQGARESRVANCNIPNKASDRFKNFETDGEIFHIAGLAPEIPEDLYMLIKKVRNRIFLFVAPIPTL